MRLSIELLQPVAVTGRQLAAEVTRIAGEQLGELVLVDETGAELIRIVSMRARARSERWGRDDLFPAERAVCPGLRAISGEVDVEAYLGSFDRGWTSG